MLIMFTPLKAICHSDYFQVGIPFPTHNYSAEDDFENVWIRMCKISVSDSINNKYR